MHDSPSKDRPHHIPFKHHRPSFDFPPPFPANVFPSVPPLPFPMPSLPSPFPSVMPSAQGPPQPPSPPKNTTDIWEILLPWWYPAHSKPPPSSTQKPKPSLEEGKPILAEEETSTDDVNSVDNSEVPDALGSTEPTEQSTEPNEETTTLEVTTVPGSEAEQPATGVDEEQSLVDSESIPEDGGGGEGQSIDQTLSANLEPVIGEDSGNDRVTTTESAPVGMGVDEAFVSTLLVGESGSVVEEPSKESVNQNTEQSTSVAEESHAEEIPGEKGEGGNVALPEGNQGQDEEFVSVGVGVSSEGELENVPGGMNNEEKEHVVSTEGNLGAGVSGVGGSAETITAGGAETPAFSVGVDEEFVPGGIDAGSEGGEVENSSGGLNNGEKDHEIDSQNTIGAEESSVGGASEASGAASTEAPANAGADEEFVSMVLVSSPEGAAETPDGETIEQERLATPNEKDPSLFVGTPAVVIGGASPIEAEGGNLGTVEKEAEHPILLTTSIVESIDGLIAQSVDDAQTTAVDPLPSLDEEDQSKQTSLVSDSLDEISQTHVDTTAGKDESVLSTQDDLSLTQQEILPSGGFLGDQAIVSDFGDAVISQFDFPVQDKEEDQPQVPITSLVSDEVSLGDRSGGVLGASEDAEANNPPLPDVETTVGSDSGKSENVGGEPGSVSVESASNSEGQAGAEDEVSGKDTSPSEDENLVTFGSPSFFDKTEKSSEEDEDDELRHITPYLSNGSEEEDELDLSVFAYPSFFDTGVRRSGAEGEDSGEKVTPAVAGVERAPDLIPDHPAPVPPTPPVHSSDESAIPSDVTAAPSPSVPLVTSDEMAAAMEKIERDSIEPIVEFLDPSASITDIFGENGVLK